MQTLRGRGIRMGNATRGRSSVAQGTLRGPFVMPRMQIKEARQSYGKMLGVIYACPTFARHITSNSPTSCLLCPVLYAVQAESSLPSHQFTVIAARASFESTSTVITRGFPHIWPLRTRHILLTYLPTNSIPTRLLRSSPDIQPVQSRP
jgi:hypothetical protein